MRQTSVNIVDMSQERFWGLGPFVLDMQQYRAFLFDVALKVTDEQFEALFFLAQEKLFGKGNPVPFEKLYYGAWKFQIGKPTRSDAHTDMDDLINIFNAAGKGIVWIDALPKERFSLRLLN